MNRLMTILLAGVWAMAAAQAPPGGEQAAGADPGADARPCVAASDNGSPDGEQEDGGPDSIPCEELDPQSESGEILAGPEDTGEEEPEVEVSAEEVFEASDEISEDYPVPLPSDI